MMIRYTFVLCLFLGLIPLNAYALDGNQLLKEVDRKLEPESYEMYRKFINIDPEGAKKEYTLYMVKKGQDKIAGVFIAPASEKGRTTLRLDENMWLYVPNVGKPVRITSMQSVIGGVFNNSDIMRLDFSVEYNVEQVEDLGTEYQLHLKARSNNVAYDRLNMWVNQSTKLPSKIECRTNADMLIKTLYYKETKDFGGGIARPSVIETDSPLYKGYKSIMIYAQIKAKDLKDEVFTLTFMPNLESLR